MTIKRIAQVPGPFRTVIKESCSKADLVEIVWDLMMQSPWFDEEGALKDPAESRQEGHGTSRDHSSGGTGMIFTITHEQLHMFRSSVATIAQAREVIAERSTDDWQWLSMIEKHTKVLIALLDSIAERGNPK